MQGGWNPQGPKPNQNQPNQPNQPIQPNQQSSRPIMQANQPNTQNVPNIANQPNFNQQNQPVQPNQFNKPNQFNQPGQQNRPMMPMNQGNQGFRQTGQGPQMMQNFDFNKISQMPSKYPREELPENVEHNMDLGGSYQQFIYKLGDCCGNIRICCPCCCCVDYPYKQIDQSYVGIYERFGRYVKTMGSGLQYFNPFTDRIHVVDMKTNIINLQRQKALTKDNIEVTIDAAVYYHVKIARKTFYAVQNIQKSVRELTFATLRSICGQYVLQDLLQKRDEVTLELGKFVARQVHEWGIQITNILIKDIVLNQQLQNTLAAVAKQKRLAESKILNAQAEVESAKLMRQTADILSGKAAMQIRYLEALKGIASNAGVKVVFLAEEN